MSYSVVSDCPQKSVGKETAGTFKVESKSAAQTACKVASGTGAQDKQQKKVKASGRIGEIERHDPMDTLLTYKLKFSDGMFPEADWFGEAGVEDIESCIEDCMDRARSLPTELKVGKFVHVLSINTTFTFNGVLYYVVQRRFGSKQHKPVARRYNDFCKLDKMLASSQRLTRAKLPPSEHVGLRRMLDENAFLQNREEGLQQYLDHLAEQTGGVNDAHVVEFLRRSSTSFSPFFADLL